VGDSVGFSVKTLYQNDVLLQFGSSCSGNTTKVKHLVQSNFVSAKAGAWCIFRHDARSLTMSLRFKLSQMHECSSTLSKTVLLPFLFHGERHL